MLDILLVDDEPSILLSVDEALKGEGYRTTTAFDGLSAQTALAGKVFDVVICDVRLPKVDGFSIFKKVRKESPQTHIIMMTAYATVPDAVSALKQGAVDYLSKPFDLDALLAVLARITRERQLSEHFSQQRVARNASIEDDVLIGRSPAMERMKARIEKFAHSDAPLFITGESGSGKETVARVIHKGGLRGSGPFVALNCGAFDEGSLEGELFGIDTPAVKKAGKLAEAQSGTLFLDDVTELSAAMQSRLLRLLETNAFEAGGPHHVRLVCASSRDVKALVASGRFREDLYYRLRILELRVPTLRERGGDLMLLVEHFLRRFCAPSTPPEVAAGALAALSAYPFPGNVRELSHAIRQAVVVSGGRKIELQHLPPELAGSDVNPAALASNGELRSLPEAVRDFEREYLKRALQKVEGRRTEAANLLGISRKNLWEKLKGYAITDLELRKPPTGTADPEAD